MRISDWSSDVCSSELSAQERLSSARLTFPESRHEGGYGSGFLFHLAAHEGHAPGFPYQFHHRIHMLAGKSRSDILDRSEEHTSELQSLMRISYAVFCLKKKTKNKNITS